MNFEFEPLVRNVVENGLYHLKNIGRVQLCLSQTDSLLSPAGLITLCSGLPKKSRSELQLLQNSAAPTLTKTRNRAHVALFSGLPVLGLILRIFCWFTNLFNAVGPVYLSDWTLFCEPSVLLLTQSKS